MDNSFLLSIISFIIILGPLIIIHELGHFLACRMVGVTVLEFGLGIPPRAAKLFEWRGTEFTLNWLPVGGFVRPLGEDFVKPIAPAGGDPETIRAAMQNATPQQIAKYEQYKADLEAIGKRIGKGKVKAMMDAKPLQRLWFLFAGSFFNFIGAYVILVLVATLSLPPIIQGVAPDSPASRAGIKENDIVVTVNGKEYPDRETINAALKGQGDKPNVIVVDRQGERKEITIQPLAATDKGFAPAVIRINGTSKGMPAEGKFQSGDMILSVDGKRLRTVDLLRKHIQDSKGGEITLVVDRGGEDVTVKVAAKETTNSSTGAKEYLIGVNLEELKFDTVTGIDVRDRARGVPLGEAFGVALDRSRAILEQLITFPIDLIRGVLPIEQARPVSIVGISQVGGEFLERSLQERDPFWVLNYAALISIALGFTNLLPIPGLDGGRILFVFIEILRGKPMNPEREGAIHMVGLLIILGLFVLLIINDIVNPIGRIFSR